jgi:hypothetical protein
MGPVPGIHKGNLGGATRLLHRQKEEGEKMKLIDNIKLSLTRADHTKEDYQDEWRKTANKYEARITYNGKSMTVTYYTGRGWKRDPDLEDILGSLLLEASLCDYNLEDFARELGYDLKEAEKIYKEIQKQAKKLKRIFTKEELEELLTYLEKRGKL